MLKLEEISKKGDSSEQVVNLLYNTGYRLTGSHKRTQALLTSVFIALNGNINTNIALKNLCLIYMNKATYSPGKKLTQDKSSPPVEENSTSKVQKALLKLPSTERLVLVLREILGLSCDEIAELTVMENMEVSRLLNTGRWALRKQLELSQGV